MNKLDWPLFISFWTMVFCGAAICILHGNDVRIILLSCLIACVAYTAGFINRPPRKQPPPAEQTDDTPSQDA